MFSRQTAILYKCLVHYYHLDQSYLFVKFSHLYGTVPLPFCHALVTKEEEKRCSHQLFVWNRKINPNPEKRCIICVYAVERSRWVHPSLTSELSRELKMSFKLLSTSNFSSMNVCSSSQRFPAG